MGGGGRWLPPPPALHHPPLCRCTHDLRVIHTKMQLSVSQYDQLERAITNGTRLQLYRRGSEFLVIPERLRLQNGRELIVARHPSTGSLLEIYLDELDGLEIVQ
jgi:hypothetical protein